MVTVDAAGHVDRFETKLGHGNEKRNRSFGDYDPGPDTAHVAKGQTVARCYESKVGEIPLPLRDRKEPGPRTVATRIVRLTADC